MEVYENLIMDEEIDTTHDDGEDSIVTRKNKSFAKNWGTISVAVVLMKIIEIQILIKYIKSYNVQIQYVELYFEQSLSTIFPKSHRYRPKQFFGL